MGSNFRGKSEKALKINFRGFKFRDSNQSRAWHCCISDDVIDTRARDLLCYYAIPTETWTKGMRW